jgi:ribonucleoside-diphosphate reductase alpha chain
MEKQFMSRQKDNNAYQPSKKFDSATQGAPDGMAIEPSFATPGTHPFDEITWSARSAHIGDSKGNTIFNQDDIEVPEDWSQLATNVVASKYFYGENGTDGREGSLKQLVHRVTRTIADWGKEDGVFATDEDAERFYQDLTYLCINQMGSFNSPVWFNVGLSQQYGVTGSQGNSNWDAEADKAVRTDDNYVNPQGSACFIQSVKDTMEDIMRLARDEAMLFKYGSGTGSDLSTLRSSREKLAGGGTPSGPLSFMRVFDQIAGVVKSGGKTRRAAKMQSLRVTHPDIKEFIECKTKEEHKAWALIEQGYDGSFNGEAYASVMYQNANLSIRVTDEFLAAVEANSAWTTISVMDEQPMDTYKARELMDAIAEGTHVCGDPGLQYHTTINRWHTCKDSGEICASNPCSEYMFVNDSACNLASLNLMKFVEADGRFDIDRFRAAARLFIIAQDILVDRSSYPSELICTNSHKFRPLGLGYANLGAMLMRLGLPYDSDEGRAMGGAITAILTGQGYLTSAELASGVGAFTEFDTNRRSMLGVMNMHRSAVDNIDVSLCGDELFEAAGQVWDDVLDAGERHGFRNAQVSVLAPTGTIGFMMDCDTTGIEPDIALVKYKKLAGGGSFKIVNQTVPAALERLGYNNDEVVAIIEYVDTYDTIEGAPHLKDEHLAVFDCAFKAEKGSRSIHYMGHIRMMAAVQTFISGAISKTVNVPTEITAEEISQIYMDGWHMGLKAVAIYRDGSKRTQPLNVTVDADEKKSVSQVADAVQAQALEAAMAAPARRRLPDTRPSITHKFSVAQHEGYLNVGKFDDGSPGELFITMAKEGSTVGGLMDAFATAISLCLQYGVTLEDLVKKFSHQRFEPNGMTANRDIPFAKSIVDYIFRWLGMEFLEGYRQDNAPKRPAGKKNDSAPEAVRDDDPSEPGRTAQTSDKDVNTSGGALNSSASGGYARNASSPQAVAPRAVVAVKERTASRVDQQFEHFQVDAPPCDNCGSLTVRNGNCYKCHNCGASLGCS